MRVQVLSLVMFIGSLEIASADDTVLSQSGIDPVTTQETTLEHAQRWGIKPEDWSRYQHVMQGPRGVWSPNLDPITALGVAADNEADRKRYAELLVRLERDRTQKELAFEKAVQQAKRDLFPNDAVIDREALQRLVHARKDEVPMQSGDRLLLFVNLECAACRVLTQKIVSDVQSTPGLQLDLYVTGHVRDDAIQAWAKLLKLPQGLVQQNRLTLNHDNSTLSRLTQDPLLTVPVLIRKRGETFTVLPTDPVALTRWSQR